MTMIKFAAGTAAALAAALLASTAFAAQGEGGYACQTFNMAKASPPTTHCITWTKAGAARMRAANCDPSRMSTAAMRTQCAELMAAPGQAAPASAGG
jgi:hypothetical protein